jgi:hypothetical protein
MHALYLHLWRRVARALASFFPGNADNFLSRRIDQNAQAGDDAQEEARRRRGKGVNGSSQPTLYVWRTLNGLTTLAPTGESRSNGACACATAFALQSAISLPRVLF